MKKTYLLLLAISICMYTFGQTLELKDIVSGVYSPKGVPATVSSTDGEFYFQENPERTKIVKYSYKTGEPVTTVFDVETARDCHIKRFDGFMMSPDENRLLVYTDTEPIYRRSKKANYYYFDIRRNLLKKLTENSSKQQSPVFSNDGRMLAFVVDNNIWIAMFDYGTERQITKDGEFNKIINGSTDWAYEEEFAITELMEFSPDNKLLAFIKFDETNIPEFSFQKFSNQLYPDSETFKYPKAGETNSIVKCNIYDIDSKTTREVTFPDNFTYEYIPKIKFAPNSDLAIMTLNRDQNDFSMFLTNPRTQISKLALREQNDKYINYDFFNSIKFFDDKFTYISEKDGFSHIYLYATNGTPIKQLTSGNYDVMSILAYNPQTNTIFYEAAEESPLKRDIYKIDIAKGTKTKLNKKSGYNNARFSNNGKYFINNWSNASTPNIITMNDDSGKELRTLEDNKNLFNKLKNTAIPQKEFITVNGANGTPLNGWMIKPTNFNSSQKYPLLMVQYSGPDSQEVLDRFNIDWVSYLANQGYIIACIDGRGTGARGQDFRKTTYMNLGIKESDDQIAAAKYFASLPYIDDSNINIWGWSYGGYNVLMTLSRSKDLFKSGVAIAPVTKWDYYDSVYTERYMKTPQQNQRGYTEGSPINLAKDLSGNLLLIHGSADDNVHFQNTMDYTSALINANKQFDLFVFPDLNHGIPGKENREYLYTKIINFLRK